VFSIRDRRTEDEMEIRRLRTENLLVRQKLDQLEQESSELADRLIQDQVTRAEEEERRFLLVAELEETRERLQQQTTAVEAERAAGLERAAAVERRAGEEAAARQVEIEKLRAKLKQVDFMVSDVIVFMLSAGDGGAER